MQGLNSEHNEISSTRYHEVETTIANIIIFPCVLCCYSLSLCLSLALCLHLSVCLLCLSRSLPPSQSHVLPVSVQSFGAGQVLLSMFMGFLD